MATNGERARLRYDLAALELLIDMSDGLDDALAWWESSAAAVRSELAGIVTAGAALGAGTAAGPQLVCLGDRRVAGEHHEVASRDGRPGGDRPVRAEVDPAGDRPVRGDQGAAR